MDEFQLHAVFDFVDPDELWEMWLDGEAHAAMTGAGAEGSAEVGAKFTAWDGYIEGTNLELESPTRIVQAWRTSQFADDDPDSRLELTFLEAEDGGTLLKLHHSNIPAGQGEDYLQGWNDHYFEPMQAYFEPED